MRDQDTDRDRKMVSFVTNKWLVGLLVSLVITMGGYIFTNMDKSRDTDLARAYAMEHRVNKLEVDMATINAQYAEILRRLDRIEYRR